MCSAWDLLLRMRLVIFVSLLFLLLMFLGYGFYRTEAIRREVETRFPAIGQFVDVDGGRLHLVDLGPRNSSPEKTIVLLHGATANLRDMVSSIGEPLSKQYRIIAIDRPGHGWSERRGGRKDARLEVQARLVAQALDKIGVTRATILGHSWAGALVLKLALDYPQLTQSIILISPVTHPWPGGVTWYYTASTIPVIGEVFVNAIVAPVAVQTMPAALAGVFAPSVPPKDYAVKTGAALVFRPDEFRANSEDVRDLLPQVVEQASRYKGLTIPALIFAPDTDTVASPVIHAQTIAKEISGAKLVILKGAGHAPHHSRTAEVVQEIDAFMAGPQK